MHPLKLFAVYFSAVTFCRLFRMCVAQYPRTYKVPAGVDAIDLMVNAALTACAWWYVAAS